ncbi:MAG TPA: hypothetical protein VJ483_04495, partial [Holophagaceae bacterium]|nr:hypothetical protein [Holophagaceae bacterium]
RDFQRRLHASLAGRLPWIACGGISTAAHVRESLADGAVLAQIYSALIFEGPGLVKRLHQELATS